GGLLIFVMTWSEVVNLRTGVARAAIPEESPDAGHRRDHQGEAGHGAAVRGGGQGAGGEGERQRAGLPTLRAAPGRGRADLRLHGALRGPGRGGGAPGNRLLQGARTEDGRVHGRSPGGAAAD